MANDYDVSNHPDNQELHSLPKGTPEDGTEISTPDFSGKITGRNSKADNYEDQRSMDNYTRNMATEWTAGKWRKGLTR